MERGAYRGRGRGRNGNGDRNSYGGRGSYGGGREGNGDHNSYGGGRGGRGGRNSYGGGGRNGDGDRGGFRQHSQSDSGGDRSFPSRSQWQPRPNPSFSSPKPNNSHSQVQTQTQAHPDIGSLKTSEKNMDTITPVRRPDNGGTVAVRKCNLHVNHFPVSFNPQSIIMHYNVEVKAKAPPPKNNRPPKKISKYDLSLIRDTLFSDNSLPSSAYDGEKNIFSAVPLPEEAFTVDVSKGEEERPVSYLVSLKLVSRLELRKLRDYLSGSVLSIPRDVLHGLDLVVKENPAKQCVSLGRCFFPMNPPLRETDLNHGIIAIGGFQQSLKSTSQGLSLCLDYSVLSFRKKLSVLDFLHEHIRDFDLRDFGRFRRQVEHVLIGLKVNVKHRKTKQKYTITRLTSKVTRHITFPILDPEGRNPPKEATLVGYFLEKYDWNIEYKDIPALDFGGNKTNFVPMELCELVEGQRYPKENLDKYAAKDLKDMSVAPPRVRQSTIQTMVNSKEGPCG